MEDSWYITPNICIVCLLFFYHNHLSTWYIELKWSNLSWPDIPPCNTGYFFLLWYCSSIYYKKLTALFKSPNKRSSFPLQFRSYFFPGYDYVSCNLEQLEKVEDDIQVPFATSIESRYAVLIVYIHVLLS